jgi:hypothetical protein
VFEMPHSGCRVTDGCWAEMPLCATTGGIAVTAAVHKAVRLCEHQQNPAVSQVLSLDRLCIWASVNLTVIHTIKGSSRLQVAGNLVELRRLQGQLS